jgi:DnaD/phage-associated family protein
VARSKPWLKLWTEILRDPKLAYLPLSEKGAWVLLLCVAQECNADGALVNSAGHPLSIGEIAKQMFAFDRTEIATVRRMISHMVEHKSLKWDVKTLVVVNFVRRQALSPSDTKQAMRDRQQKHRERIKNQRHEETCDVEPTYEEECHEKFVTGDNTTTTITSTVDMEDSSSSNPSPLPLPLPPKTRDRSVRFEPRVDIKARAKRAPNARQTRASHEISRDIEANPKKSRHVLSRFQNVTTPVNSASLDEATGTKNSATLGTIREVCRLYETNIGSMPPLLYEKVCSFADVYHGQFEWIELAFREATDPQRSNWSYISRILETWQDNGGPRKKDLGRGQQGAAPDYILRGLEEDHENAGA